jgi:hypothetical protein
MSSKNLSQAAKHTARLTRLIIPALLLVILSVSINPVYAVTPTPTPKIPPIPLYLGIDQFGAISLTSGYMELPRQVARLKAPAAASQLMLLGEKLFVLRFDGYDTVFDLEKHPVNVINFDRGFYQAVKLSTNNNSLLVEAKRTFVRNDKPDSQLTNLTAIQLQAGRRSCLESAFHSRMDGVVLNPVRLRKYPYIPEDLDLNWIGSLRTREPVYILQTYCNAGSWLRIQRESGRIGWAKEWGLTEELVERTFIAPITLK